MGHLKSLKNSLNEGNLTLVSAQRSHASSLSNSIRYLEVQNFTQVEKCWKEVMKTVQMGHLKSLKDGLDEGNLTLVTA